MRLLLVTGLAAGLWAKGPGVTFSHDVAPIVYRHCVACHHPGAVAFPLVTFADVYRRAGLIARVTAARYMPPWLPAEPHFAHERRLSEAEIAALGQWAAVGA